MFKNPMAEIELVDGALRQWDTDRKVKITPAEGYTLEGVQLARFRSTDITSLIPAEDNTVTIPNSVLEQTDSLVVYAYLVTARGKLAVKHRTFSILAYPRPEDYSGCVTDEHINALIDAAPHVKSVNNNAPDESRNVVVTYSDLADAPCGVRTVEEVLNGLENITATMASVASGSGTSAYVSTPYFYEGDLEAIEVGCKYKVVINGEETVVEAKRNDYLGNRKINFPSSTWSDNPEANFYLETDFLVSLKRCVLFLPIERKGEKVTVSIYKCTDEITPLPLKFVPDEIQRVGEPLYLSDSAGAKWQLVVETDGTLTTTEVTE